MVRTRLIRMHEFGNEVHNDDDDGDDVDDVWGCCSVVCVGFCQAGCITSKHSPEATGHRGGHRIVVGNIVLGNRRQMRRQLVGRTQDAHRARRQLPHQPLAVRHLVLAIVARQNLDDSTEVLKQRALGDLRANNNKKKQSASVCFGETASKNPNQLTRHRFCISMA